MFHHQQGLATRCVHAVMFCLIPKLPISIVLAAVQEDQLSLSAGLFVQVRKRLDIRPLAQLNTEHCAIHPTKVQTLTIADIHNRMAVDTALPTT